MNGERITVDTNILIVDILFSEDFQRDRDIDEIKGTESILYRLKYDNQTGRYYHNQRWFE